MMTNNLLKFPSIRMAFKQTTDALDNLAQEAVKINNEAVAEAYRNAFSLVRESIKQAENLGESKLQKQIVDTMDEILKSQHELLQKQAERTRNLVDRRYDAACTDLATDLINALKKAKVDKDTLNDNLTELYEAAAYHVSKYYEEKGIDT
tara:strand:+ start:527 stop:976 length:450 start_codon:yes stop_codon:yes gene_type:complete